MPPPVYAADQQPWFLSPPPLPRGAPVTVVGGGVAGAAAAWSLARRGAPVVLIERQSRLATGASGNPAAVVLPVVNLAPNANARFHAAAYELALAQIDAFAAAGRDIGWDPCGVVHLPTTETMRQRLARLDATGAPRWLARRMDRARASELAGADAGEDVMYYERGGVLDPAAYARAFASHAGVEIRLSREALRLERAGEVWRVWDGADRLLSATPGLVIATAHEALRFAQTAWLPIRQMRGQLALIAAERVRGGPKAVICYKGFALPPRNGDYMLGATWGARESTALSMTDHRSLIAAAARHLPAFRFDDEPPLRGRAAYRAKSPDHLPLVGPAPDAARFREAYADLRHGRPAARYPAPPCWPGLYLTVAHGSRGMITAHLAGETLATQILGESPPVGTDLIAAVNPARYLIRAIKRGA